MKRILTVTLLAMAMLATQTNFAAAQQRNTVTIAELAKEVGLSRSALVERFTRYLSEPPMANWEDQFWRKTSLGFFIAQNQPFLDEDQI